MRQLRIAFTACVVLLGSAALAAADPATPPSAAEIMRRVAERSQGRDLSARAVWRLFNAKGQERTRETRIFQRDARGDGGDVVRQWLMVVVDPPLVRGTGLLVWEHASGSADQWLYVPAYRKTRRLGEVNRGESVLGSEFMFEDLRAPRDDESHVFLREEELDGAPCAVIESSPHTPNTARRRTWVDLRHFTTPRVEFLSREGQLARTLRAGWKELSGIWLWERLEMRDERSQRHSVVELSGHKVDSGLAPELFTQTTLRSGVH